MNSDMSDGFGAYDREMNKKRVIVIAWALGAILSASPAHALIAVHETDLTPNQSDADFVVFSDTPSESIAIEICGYSFSFEQRANIGGGPPVVAFTEFVYTPGRKDLYSFGMSCDGYQIYGAGTCAC